MDVPGGEIVEEVRYLIWSTNWMYKNILLIKVVPEKRENIFKLLAWSLGGPNHWHFFQICPLKVHSRHSVVCRELYCLFITDTSLKVTWMAKDKSLKL